MAQLHRLLTEVFKGSLRPKSLAEWTLDMQFVFQAAKDALHVATCLAFPKQHAESQN